MSGGSGTRMGGAYDITVMIFISFTICFWICEDQHIIDFVPQQLVRTVNIDFIYLFTTRALLIAGGNL